MRHAPQRSIPSAWSNSDLGGTQFGRDSGLVQAIGIGRPLSCIRYGRPSTARRSLRMRPNTRLELSKSSLVQPRTRPALTTHSRPAKALERDPYHQVRLRVGPVAAALFMALLALFIALLAARYLLSGACRLTGSPPTLSKPSWHPLRLSDPHGYPLPSAPLLKAHLDRGGRGALTVLGRHCKHLSLLRRLRRSTGRSRQPCWPSCGRVLYARKPRSSARRG